MSSGPPTAHEPTLADRVAALAQRHRLAEEATERLADLARCLSTGTAPTALDDLARICDDHLADSLVALDLSPVGSASHIADLGSGAGLPGLPLAVARPDARVTLVESNARRCEYLTATVRRLDLDNVSVVRSRAEQWRDGLEGCDLVVVRALAALPVVAEYAAPLLRVGGALVAWRGRRDRGEEARGAAAAVELGLRAHDPVAVSPYPAAVHRHLHMMVKVAPTAARFPRRPGIARKHPLGGPAARTDGRV